MKKTKNMIILIFVLAALSMVAYSVSYNKSKITQVTADISLEEVKDCETIIWTETEPVYDYVTRERDVYDICSGFSEENQTWYNYTCLQGTEEYQSYEKIGEKQVEKSKEVCKDTKMKTTINTLSGTKNYNLQYGEWGKCSYETEQDTLVITCDSKYDGNNDGICHPGESCIQFRVTKDNIQRLEKNSRYDFIEEDETFFLDKLSMEEVS